MTRLLRLPDVQARVPLHRATIYAMVKAGEFPAPRKLGTASLWPEDEIDAWVVAFLGRDATPAAADPASQPTAA
jgi:prophage regulatory protein